MITPQVESQLRPIYLRIERLKITGVINVHMYVATGHLEKWAFLRTLHPISCISRLAKSKAVSEMAWTHDFMADSPACAQSTWRIYWPKNHRAQHKLGQLMQLPERIKQ